MMVTKELDKLRGNLDRVDRRLVEILDERLRAVAGIARLKAEGLPFLRDHERESELLSRVEGWARELGIDEFRTQEIFRELIAMSLKAQEEALLKRDRAQQSVESAHRVAFQGIDGSYSHIAARKYFAAQASQIEFVGRSTFAAALEEAETGGAGYAFLPIENTNRRRGLRLPANREHHRGLHQRDLRSAAEHRAPDSRRGDPAGPALPRRPRRCRD